MIGPPPRFYPKDLSKQFASDPFCGRMVKNNAGRDNTPLSVLIECWYWYETHKAEVGPAFEPMANSIRACIEREAPDALQEIVNASEDRSKGV